MPNHLFTLRCKVAMKPLNSFEDEAVRSEKAKLMQAIQPMQSDEEVCEVYEAGQQFGADVPAYRADPDVAPDSNTETYIALSFSIENWRWAEVSFYLRTGKRLTGVDVAARKVSVTDVGQISYDQLVIATGAVSSWFGHEDWAKRSVGLKNLRDAEVLHLRLFGAFEWAERRSEPEEVGRLLTFVVVGGGPSGIELAGSISDLTRYTLYRDFRRIRSEQTRLILFEGGPDILAGYPACALCATATRSYGGGSSHRHTGRCGRCDCRRQAHQRGQRVLVRRDGGDSGHRLDRYQARKARRPGGRRELLGAGASGDLRHRRRSQLEGR